MKRISEWTDSDWRLAALSASALAGGVAGFIVGLIRGVVEESADIAYQEGYDAHRLEVSCGKDQGSQGQGPTQNSSDKPKAAGNLGADHPAGVERTDGGRETSLGTGAAGDLLR